MLKSCNELFAAAVATQPDKTAVVADDMSLTFAELDALSDAVADTLVNAGIQPRSRVPILLERGARAVAAMLGAWKADCAFCVVSLEYPPERVEYIRVECAAPFVIDAAWIEKATASREKRPVTIPDPDAPAIIVFTSGSTGNPKGVVVPHRAVSLALRGDVLGRTADDVFLSVAAFSFIAVVIDVLTPLSLGATVHIASDSRRRDVGQLIEYVRTNGITTMFLPPQTAAQFISLADGLLSVIVTGSEKVSRLYSAKTRIINLYGASETCGPLTYFVIDKPYDSTPIGRPYEGSSAFILDDEGKQAAVGQVGEICVSGQVALGYLNNPEQTTASFSANPFATGRDDATLYHTGDLGRMRPDGVVEYVQRKDWMLKVRGHRVEPGEIEAAMVSRSPIQRAVVVGFENANGETALYACYTADQAVPSADVEKAIAGFLPPYMLPAFMEQVPALPLNPNGKVDRKSIHPPEIERYKTEYIKPENETESSLVAAFEKILGVQGLGAQDDFRMLGGDSVSAVRLQALLPKMGLSVSQILDLRTPRALAAAAGEEGKSLAKADARSDWPLTFAERQMATEQGMSPDSVAYNVNLAFRLNGPLDAGRLEKALSKLTARQRILRSYYCMEDGEFHHRIADATTVELAREDCPLDTVPNRIAQMNKPFRLDVAPLIRATLFDVGADGHVLHLCIHHIIIDGVSGELLLDELWRLYAGEDDAPDKDMPDYLDYAVWQNECGDATGKEYFQAVFADGAPENEMPTRPTRPDVLPNAGVDVTRTLDGQAVEREARRRGVTPYTLLMAAAGLTLAKYVGNDDVVLGAAMNGRDLPEAGGMIGMFVNTVPVRLKPDQGGTLDAYIEHVAAALAGARDNQTTPFESLVPMLAPDRNSSRNPVFDIIVNFLDEIPARRVDDLGVSRLPIKGQALAIDLQLEIVRNGQFMHAELAYSPDLYYPEIAAGFLDQFATIVERICGDTGGVLADVAELPDAQRKQIMTDFLPAASDEKFGQTLVSLFREAAAKNPERRAVVSGDEVIDFQTLDKMTDRLAAHLAAKGVGSGKTVGILVRRNAMMAIGAVGVLKTGAAYVPLDPTYPSDRLEYMLEDAAAGLVMLDDELRDLLPNYQGEYMTTDSVRALPDAVAPKGPEPDDTVVLLYTSGTTGKPKGVMLSHENLVSFCVWFGHNYELTNADNVAAYASFGFDACLMDLYPTLLAGACVHVIPEEMRLDLPALNAYFNANNVTVAFMTTQLGRQFAESMDNKSLRTLSVGGETLVPLEPPTSFSLYNAYGPTECTVFATLFHVDRLYDRVPLGKPLLNNAIYIVDKHGRLAPVGAAGELCIAGRQVAKGYLNRPDLTAEKFTANPFTGDPLYARVYRTGDVARYLPSGDIDFIGRRDFQVKIRGFRVELTEIEGRIRMYPGITDAAVVAKDAPAGGKCAVAYIVADSPVDIAVLNAFIEEALPPYMVPTATMQLEAIPLNPNGKVDRRKLPEPVYAGSDTEEDEDTRVATELEATIREVASGVLGHAQFGLTTDLLRAGLTSLSAIKLAAKLHDRLGVAPSVRELMRDPTVVGIENSLVRQLLENAKNPPVGPEAATGGSEAKPADYPLSQNQLGVCIDCMKRPDSLAYNIPLRLNFSSAVDADKLARAAATVIDAHPTVKAHLAMHGEEIRQAPDDSPAVIPVVDATAEELASLAAVFVKPFALFEGPLYRGTVARSPNGVTLLVDFHHIVFDGGSLDVFLRQLGTAYAGGLTNADGEKASLFDFAQAEAKREGSVQWLEDKAYFDRELSTFEGSSEIAPDLPHSDKTGKMAEAVRTVSPGKMDKFCREYGVTPAGLFLGAVSYAVGRWVNSRDVYLSTISSGRADPKLQNSFGMFVRTLPLALHFGEKEATALDFVRSGQRALSEAIDHEGYPFTRIAQDYGFDPAIMFAFELGVTGDYQIAGEKAVIEPLAAAETKFKLSIHVEERGGLPAFAVQYDDSLYSQSLMERFTDTLVTAFDNIVADPAAPIRALSLVSPEQRELLAQFNQTDGELPEPILHRMFEKAAATYPDRTALAAAEGKYTYRELDAEANRVANALIAMGVGMEDRVAFMLNRTGGVLIAMLGILKAGGCYIPVDPAYPAERIRHVLDDSNARFLLTTKDRVDEFPGAVELDALRTGDKTRSPDLPVRPNQLAYMIYTSGSTGKPKGVMIEHHGIANYVTNHPFNRHVHALVEDASVMMSITTVAFDMFLKESMTSLGNGLTLVFADDVAAYDPLALAELFRETGADAFNTTPSRMLEYMESPDLLAAIRNCKVVMAGAEKYPEALLGKLRGDGGATRLFNTYGPTEITVSSNGKELTDAKRVTIGRPLLGVHEYVVDLDGNVLPVGVVGELWIGGRGVARGYLNLPEQTAERFTEFNGERVYRSGDLARWTGDGEIEILGRNDNQIKLRGLRIELGEIENAILSYPGIRTCAVTIRKIKNADHIAAYYLASDEIDPRQLRETLAKSLAPYMVPTAYLQITSMPKTPNGKDDIRKLPDAELLRVQDYAKPENELEAALCSVFAKVLDLEEVGVNDSFFDIGGTSLAVTRVVVEAKEQGVTGDGGASIAYGDVFANPTPRELAKILSGGAATPPPREDDAAYDYARIDSLLARNTLDSYRAGGGRPLGNVLLTGATGFLGIHILKEFLDRGVGSIYCLLRRGRSPSAEARLKNMLFYYFEDNYDNLFGSRLFALEGDVTDVPSLAQLDALPIDSIINSAANVSHFSKGNLIYDVNTQGAINLIDVAKRKGAQLVQLSTHSIAGFSVDDKPPRDMRLDETMLYFGQNLENQYVSSKFLAERAVLEAARDGLDVKIMRMGNLMARDRDGEFQINSQANSFLGRLRAYQAVGCFPYSAYHSPAELAPIDSSAQAVLLLCETPPDCRVFHPYNNHYIFMGDIIAIMREVGIDVRLAEDDEYQAALAAALRDKSRAEQLVSLVAYQNVAQGRVAAPLGSSNDYTSQILYRKNWRWPETSSDYLKKFLEGMQGLGYF